MDWRIRMAAITHVTALRDRGDGVVTSAELDNGFLFNGVRIPIWNRQRGIWRPKQLSELGVALTVVTAPPVAGRKAPYDDEVADDREWFGYRYRGTDPTSWDNVAVRRACELRRPIIYLYGVAKGLYEVIAPVYVTDDSPSTLTFRLEAASPIAVKDLRDDYFLVDAPLRAYQTRAVKYRLHQHRFRELVLGAYRTRCAMCSLGHRRLLDAAHILPDHDERGKPEVANGLALCKIHHTAYDTNILGISADLLVHVREEILAEVDGPMLEHGLKGMAGRKIAIPRRAELQPNRDFLADRFERFRAA